jgi:hypothetical protein
MYLKIKLDIFLPDVLFSILAESNHFTLASWDLPTILLWLRVRRVSWCRLTGMEIICLKICSVCLFLVVII